MHSLSIKTTNKNPQCYKRQTDLEKWDGSQSTKRNREQMKSAPQIHLARNNFLDSSIEHAKFHPVLNKHSLEKCLTTSCFLDALHPHNTLSRLQPYLQLQTKRQPNVSGKNRVSSITPFMHNSTHLEIQQWDPKIRQNINWRTIKELSKQPLRQAKPLKKTPENVFAKEIKLMLETRFQYVPNQM